MSFPYLYKTIKNKIGNDEKLQSLLEKKISGNPTLAKQFLITESFTGKLLSKEEIEELVTLSEKYASKLSNDDIHSSNRELAHFFNVEYNNLKQSKVDEAIDELLQYNSGGVTSLSPRYRSNLIENLTKADDAKALLDESTLAVIHEEINASKLNLLEAEMYNVVAKNDFSKLDSKLKVITTLAESLSLKDKTFIQECVKFIKEKVNTADLKDTAYKTFDLYDTTMSLLEQNDLLGKVSSETLTNLHNVETIKLNESNKTLIDFEIHFEPKFNTYKNLHESCNRLEKQIFFMGSRQFPTWNSTVLSEHIKLEDTIVCKVQVILESEKETSQLNSLNEMIGNTFGKVLKTK